MKILFADDHPIFRAGLFDLLKSHYNHADLIECKDGAEALDMLQLHRPLIAILDINMPQLNGLEVISELKEEDTPTRFILLTMHKEAEIVKKAMDYGAYGYLLKDFASDELIECIESVVEGKKFISQELSSIFREVEHLDKEWKKLESTLRELSQAELKTLKLVSQNKTTKEIAEYLFLSEKTIENYRSKICQKLMLPPRNNSLLIWASENKELVLSIE